MSRNTTSPGAAERQVRWHVVIPVKDAEQAKSRLHAPLPLRRADLARAVASDTIEAACAAVGPALLTVVTSDAVVRELTLALGARVVPDPGQGLDAAVTAGWQDAPVAPGRAGWAALLGDIPALRAEDLRAALDACGQHARAVVPDAEGTGTVLLASTVAPPVPRFGPGSAARHGSEAGAVLLDLDLPRLRRDVDMAEDLRAAVSLGVGRHTLLAMRRGA